MMAARVSSVVKSCLVGLAGCLAAGCVSTPTLTTPGLTASSKGGASQMLVRWNNSVAVAPDPVHGGRAQPGLMGRVYLFGPDMGVPREGDGTLTVELSDAGQLGPNGAPRLIEKWILQPKDFQRMQRQDMVGTGYSLFLPWGTYRPERTQVHLRTCFQPKGGGPPLYANSGLLKLGEGVIEVRASHSSVMPGAAPAAPLPPPQPGLPGITPH